MSHERKKDGHRKDKKNERMREDVDQRQANATPKSSTDQPDIQKFKSGGPNDTSRQPNPNQR